VIIPYVKNIQIFLNNHGYQATASGTEDGIYATSTVDAVKNFQKSYISATLPNGLDNGTGYFGYTTRKKMNDIVGCSTPPPVPLGFCFARTIPPLPFIYSAPYIPSTVLSYFKTHIETIFAPDIKNLQIFLNTLGYNASVVGAETGIYTASTTEAIKKFQLDYAHDILDPQGLSTTSIPFGFFGLFSLVKANDILGCSFKDPIITNTAALVEEALATLPQATTTPQTTPATEEPVTEVPPVDTTTENPVTEEPTLPTNETPNIPTTPNQSAPNEPFFTNPTLPNAIGSVTNTYNQAIGALGQALGTLGDFINNSLGSNISESITQTYLQAMGILNQAGQAIINIVNSPVGSVVTKVIATVGIVVGALSALAGIAFATPITFS